MMAGRPALARFLPVLVGVALLVVAHLLDPWAGHALRLPSANDRDWGRLLRILGFAPTWLAIAGLFWLESRDRSGPPERAADLARTGWAIVIAVAVGGILAELAKLLIRRERPTAEFLGYQFRSFADAPFSTRSLGMPSSHTAVAFAGAAVMARRYPRTAPLLLALAAGCGLTRVFAQAHYLSDVVGGALGGSAAGWWAGRRR